MMRRLFWPATLVAAVASFYLIAPSARSEQDREGFFSNYPAIREARREVRLRGDTLRALASAFEKASAWERAKALPQDAAPYRLVVDPGVSAEARSLFSAAAEREFASLGATKLPVRVLLVSSADQVSFYRRYFVLPQAAGEPCVAVVRLPASGRKVQPAFPDRLLGTCTFYARYGMPGTGMQAYLDSTRGLTAVTDTLTGERFRRAEHRWRLGGANIAWDPATSACVAGNDDACARALLEVEPLRVTLPPNPRTAAVVQPFANWGWYSEGAALARLRASLGEEKFARVWHSDMGPADAFQAVSGEHIATVVRPMLLDAVYPHRPGPLHASLPTALALLLGVVTAAWAIQRTPRIRTE